MVDVHLELDQLDQQEECALLQEEGGHVREPLHDAHNQRFKVGNVVLH